MSAKRSRVFKRFSRAGRFIIPSELSFVELKVIGCSGCSGFSLRLRVESRESAEKKKRSADRFPMAFICASTRLNSKYIQRPFKFFTRRCASGNVAGSSTYCVISKFLQTFLCSSNATLQPGEILQRLTIYKAKKRLLNVGKCTGTYSLRVE